MRQSPPNLLPHNRHNRVTERRALVTRAGCAASAELLALLAKALLGAYIPRAAYRVAEGWRKGGSLMTIPRYEIDEREPPVIVKNLTLPRPLADKIDDYGRGLFTSRTEVCRYLLVLAIETLTNGRQFPAAKRR